ncbi:MAG: DUF2703 domain-containing protein [Gammaproteobacteria bacterium]|nr:DUF2703 domain-containing protein [Gammaproteobacteria bacterium]
MKQINIEWRHLEVDGNTCIRCNDTGNTLQQVIDQLNRECAPCGWEAVSQDTPLDASRIEESNGIWLNGQAIEELLPDAIAGENHCQSCCDFTGNPQTQCRTIEIGGNAYEAIPESLIRKAVCQITDCC